MQYGRIKLIVYRDAEGEYLRYEKLRFAITWGAPLGECPSQRAPLMAARTPGFNTDTHKQLTLYEYPRGEKFLGTAIAPAIKLPRENYHDDTEEAQ